MSNANSGDANRNGLTDDDIEIEQYKIKKMLAELSALRGNGTSLITIMIPAGGDLNGMKRLLVEEYGTATNIKSRVNRLSVLSAITSAQTKLKMINHLPPNGLVVYCGDTLLSSKKISLCIQPFKPLAHKMYMCDSKFHTEPLQYLLKTDEKYGFIVIDGNGTLFATLSGEAKEIHYHYKVDLPKKHNKGGQSAARFGRIAQEKRHAYITLVADMVVKYFIENDSLNVKGIIVAGSAEMKDKLTGYKDLDIRVKNAIVSVVTIGYGGLNGLDEAITKSADTMNNLRFVQEKKILASFFEALDKDQDNICYGAKDTMQALEIGAVEKLLVCEKMKYQRIVIKGDPAANPPTKDIIEYVPHPGDVQDKLDQLKILYGDREFTIEPLIDWLVENYKDQGAAIVILTDQTSEGSQFYRGFGGLAATLRWNVKFEHYNIEDQDTDEDSDFI